MEGQGYDGNVESSSQTEDATEQLMGFSDWHVLAASASTFSGILIILPRGGRESGDAFSFESGLYAAPDQFTSERIEFSCQTLEIEKSRRRAK